jgi:hypothetical protein
MDAQQLETLIRKVVGEQVAIAWWAYIILIILSVLSAIAASYIKSYLTEKGKNFATREDFDELLSQVEKQAKATEAIKRDMARSLWIGQSGFEHRVKQLAECFAPLEVLTHPSSRIASEDFSAASIESLDAEILEYLKSLNLKVIDIIIGKSHLVDDSESLALLAHTARKAYIWNLHVAKLIEIGKKPNRTDKDWEAAKGHYEFIKSKNDTIHEKAFINCVIAKAGELRRELNMLRDRHSLEEEGPGDSQPVAEAKRSS